MDIFKLLSRSTKQKPKSLAGRDGPPARIPSAGNTANPQLYHDDASETRGKKRKRGIVQEAEEAPAQVEEVIDFFAPTPASSTLRQSAPEDDEARALAKSPTLQTTYEPLAEDECRQILRSHRVKITLLAADKEIERKPTELTKASKKAESKKAESKPLYPKPLQTFGELLTTYGIAGRIGENLAQQGYKIPTEVQMGSLPLLLHPSAALDVSAKDLGVSDGNINLLAVAPTGSGKTLAFLIPIVNSIVQRRRMSKDKTHKLEAIVVAPTKELASQIVNEAKKLSIGTGVKVVGMRKGMRIIAKESEEEQDSGSSTDENSDEEEDHGMKSESRPAPLAKADVLVTTPGLLLNAISTTSSEHASLPTVKTLVLDEADVLLDPLFRDQTLRIWNSCINPELHATLWSATMGSNIEALALETMRIRRAKLRLSSKSIIVRLVVGLKDSAIPNITHRLTYAATEPGKLIALRQLLRPTAKTADSTESLRPPFLIFTQTIPRAIALHSELRYDIPAEAGGSSRIEVLHSDLSDSERSHVMARFRNGEIWVMITTDILSRGVDFRGINGVVNYDVPNSGAAYIHRVGRTGRAGRNGGVAVTFYTKEDIPYVKNIANIIVASEKQAGKAPGEASVQKWLLDALPTPTKQLKKRLKMHGVEARRAGLERGLDGRGKGKAQISTKSGYERKLENNRRGAIQGSKRRKLAQVDSETGVRGEEDSSEWGGIDD